LSLYRARSEGVRFSFGLGFGEDSRCGLVTLV
jgi:hypothetical protein